MPVIAQISPNVWFTTLVGSLAAGLATIVAFLPALLGALVILLIGWGVAKLVQTAISALFRAWHFDSAMDREGITPALRRANIRTTPSHILGVVAYWFTFLLFVSAAVAVLGIPALSALMASFIAYIPIIFVALVIIIVGAWAASLLGRITRVAMDAAGIPYAQYIGTAVQVLVLFLAFVTAANTLGIDLTFLLLLFAVVLGAIGLAGALAFGLGGRTYATDVLAGRELSSMFNPGDRMVAGDMSGTVQMINPTYTVLRTDKGDVMMNNNELVSKHVRRDTGGGGTSSMGGDMPKAA